MSKQDAILLAELEDANGNVTAERVVEAARAEDHEWHHRFEWNDTEAARRFRIDQARTLIRTVRYERKTATATFRSVAYVRDPAADPREQSYVSVIRLRADADRARDALIAESARIASALRRARELANVLELEREVSAMLQQTEGITAMLRAANNHPGASPDAPAS